MIHATSTLQIPSRVTARQYPFTDAATMTSLEGVVLPAGTFTDARIYVFGASELQYISQIEIKDNTLVIEVSDSSGVIATGSYPGSGNIVTLLDKYSREVGVLYGLPDILSSLAPSTNTLKFSQKGLPFVPSVIVPQPQKGVRGILDVDSNLVSGDVWLIGENGVILTYADNVVTVNLVGDHMFIRRQCGLDPVTYKPGRPLKKIHVIYNDGDTENDLGEISSNDYGNVNVLPGEGGAEDNVIRVRPIANGLAFSVIGNFK